MFEEMVHRGIKPNVCTFAVLINALCKEGKVDEAQCILDMIHLKGVEPDTCIYTSLINGYCLHG